MIYAIIKSIKEKKIKELIPIFLISIACIVACILLPWFFYFKPKAEIAQCSKETAAKIIQINHRTDDDNDDQYQLVYQYNDDNYAYTYNSKYSGYYRDYEIGQTITVFTDPKDPAHVIFDYTPDAFILYICAIILGGTIFICLFVDIVSLIKFIQYSLR